MKRNEKEIHRKMYLKPLPSFPNGVNKKKKLVLNEKKRKENKIVSKKKGLTGKMKRILYSS